MRSFTSLLILVTMTSLARCRPQSSIEGSATQTLAVGLDDGQMLASTKPPGVGLKGDVNGTANANDKGQPMSPTSAPPKSPASSMPKASTSGASTGAPPSSTSPLSPATAPADATSPSTPTSENPKNSSSIKPIIKDCDSTVLPPSSPETLGQNKTSAGAKPSPGSPVINDEKKPLDPNGGSDVKKGKPGAPKTGDSSKGSAGGPPGSTTPPKSSDGAGKPGDKPGDEPSSASHLISSSGVLLGSSIFGMVSGLIVLFA